MNSSEHIWGDQEVYNEEYVFVLEGRQTKVLAMWVKNI